MINMDMQHLKMVELEQVALGDKASEALAVLVALSLKVLEIFLIVFLVEEVEVKDQECIKEMI